MRKIIVSMNITLDGFIAGPDCELDWHYSRWTTEMAEALGEKLSEADTILFGRVTYNAMAEYWRSRYHHMDLPREEFAFAEMMHRYEKVVFSKTMQSACWENSVIVNGSIRKEINRLKAGPGRNMIVYGSGTLASSLMRLNLVDEYSLWIHPVFLGRGRAMSQSLSSPLRMELLSTETFSSGVVKTDFRPANRHSPFPATDTYEL